MWTTSRHALQELNKLSRFSVQCFSQTTCKNTVVVERWWQVPLSKKEQPATTRLYRRRHRVYKLVEDTKHAPKTDMELLLTQTVPKLGGRGDTVFVPKSMGRNKLLPQGLAVYPSPKNKAMFAEELRLLSEGKPEERTQTSTGEKTVELLKNTEFKIEKKTSVDYVITKEIVCRQLLKRRALFVAPHALRLPEEPIKDLGEYWCEITVNGIDTVRIPTSVVPERDRSLPRLDSFSAEAILEADTVSVPEAVAAAVPETLISETFTSVGKEAAMTEATAPLPDVSATAPLPDVSATAPLPDVSATAPLPVVSATSPVPDVSATAPVSEVSAAASTAPETVSAPEASATPEVAAKPVIETAATPASPEASATASTPETAVAPEATNEDKTHKKD